jgi:hypothetical protein
MPLNILSDELIQELICETKAIPAGLRPFTAKLVERNKHKRKDFEVKNASGNEFVIMVRQSTLNTLDFSAILGYKMPGLNTIFRLRRYNGKHVHTNSIERTTLNDFHFHTATERYQRKGLREDTFAEVSSRHCTLDSAIDCLLEDCGFTIPRSDQYRLPLTTPE